MLSSNQREREICGIEREFERRREEMGGDGR